MSDIQEFNLSIDLTRSILWQYNDAEKLNKIIEYQNADYQTNVIDFLNDWYTNVFNVETANDFGLSVWAIILNVNFNITGDSVRPENAFGFLANFNNVNFSPSGNAGNTLTTEQKRLIIKMTYQKYFAPSNMPEINRIIQATIDPYGYALDNLDMSITIYLSSSVIIENLSLIDDYDLLPIPAGVRYTIESFSFGTFGFSPFGRNFYKSNFNN